MMGERLKIYVPGSSEVAASILPGSGIVGRPRGENVLLDYEGNKYGMSQYETWEGRVSGAWGRATENCPTVARMVVPRSDVIAVGAYDGESFEVWSQAEVDEWLDEAGELKPWATRFREAYSTRGDLATAERLVVVWAQDAEQARTRSGLVAEPPFYEASEEDLEEWTTELEKPWDRDAVDVLIRLARRRQREIGKQRVKDRQTGRWQTETPGAFDANRAIARKLTYVTAKLDQEAQDGY